MFEPSKGAIGRTLTNLAAAGIDPKSIDIVLMSHLHPDHTNGIRAADNSMAFPNAEIMVPAKDWEFWMSDDNDAKAQSNQMMKDYFANVRKVYAGIEDKVTKYDWDKEVAPGITASRRPAIRRATPSFVVASGSSKILIQSDVTNIPELFLRNPDWHVALRHRSAAGARKPATSSTTWRRPRRRWWSASTSRSRRRAMWRRTARSTA